MLDYLLTPKNSSLIVLFSFLTICSFAQSSFSLPNDANTLEQALSYLQQRQQVQYSCNSKLANSCLIATSSNFETVEEALQQWLKPCQLVYRKIEGVYVIFKPLKNNNKGSVQQQRYHYSGTIVDANNRTALPFSTVSLGYTQLLTDENGQFSLHTKDSVLPLSVGHLGYYQYSDSAFRSGTKVIAMLPSLTQLKTVTIEAGGGLNTINLIEKPTVDKININSSTLIPSNSNNNIHAAIRLRPGVLAAGEQARDFIIWGSYRGQSQVIFDGITIFSASSISEDIGSINPLVVKDVEIHKGGYQVELGDRVGGIVNILSKTGDSKRLRGDIVLSNQSINASINLPFKQKSALQICLRSTFPDLFNPLTYQVDTSIKYHYGDFNLKYDGLTSKDNRVLVSVLGNIDNYSTAFSESEGNKNFVSNQRNNRYQLGGALQYHHQWQRFGRTKFSTAFSYLNSRQSNLIEFDDTALNPEKFAGFNEISNAVSEYYIKAEHRLPSTKLQSISFALGFHFNQSDFDQDSINRPFKNNRNSTFRITSYIKDRINLGKYLSIEPGLKVDLSIGKVVRPFLQPRVNIQIKPHPLLRLKLAWGLYNQYVVEYAFVDNLDNRLFFWDVPDNLAKKALRSMHSVAALSFGRKYINFKIEGYYKTTQNLTQFVEQPDSLKLVNLEGGVARSYGIDTYVNTEFLGQKIWFAYSWAHSQERFGPAQQFRRALHDQRHEFKVAGLFNWKPMYFSINYVFGSGLPNPLDLLSEENIQPYSRLDVALMGRYQKEKFSLDIGVSVINVLNTQNILYDQYSSFPDGSIRFSTADGIRPALFLQLSF